MISTEWGHPRCFMKGLDVEDVAKGNYGTHINVYDWQKRKLIQKIDLGMEGVMPLEIRFLHDPRSAQGFVGSALYANVFRFYKTGKGDWSAHKVIDIPAKKVEGNFFRIYNFHFYSTGQILKLRVTYIIYIIDCVRLLRLN